VYLSVSVGHPGQHGYVRIVVQKILFPDFNSLVVL
jgi:hypothetical protein